jgi:hypothetical protein
VFVTAHRTYQRRGDDLMAAAPKTNSGQCMAILQSVYLQRLDAAAVHAQFDRVVSVREGSP